MVRRSARPVIAVNCDFEKGSPREHPFLPLVYVAALERAGAVPFLVAPLASPRQAGLLAARADGMMFTGSDDIDPKYYGERKEPACGRLVPRVKTDTDLALFHAARRRGLPFLGICGGFQLANVALGGTLLQDIPTHLPGALRHKVPAVKMPSRRVPTHPVDVLPGTRLSRLVGSGRRHVNSSHHQAVGHLGRGLVVSAIAPDGVIEAIESVEERYLVAVEWHPERLPAGHRMREPIFSDFVAAARRYARTKRAKISVSYWAG